MKKLLPHEEASRLQLVAAVAALGFRSSFLGMANNLTNERDLVDLNLLKTIALPAANATADSAAIDLNTTTGGRVPRVELRVTVPATPSLADTYSITLTIQDSADNSSFAAVADLPPIVIGPAAGGTGGAAVDRRLKLPLGTRQYVRLHLSVPASAGNNTAITAQINLLF